MNRVAQFVVELSDCLFAFACALGLEKQNVRYVRENSGRRGSATVAVSHDETPDEFVKMLDAFGLSDEVVFQKYVETSKKCGDEDE